MYLHGVKNIIRASNLHKIMDDSYVARLTGWVYYHDVMAQFSRIHWKHSLPADPVPGQFDLLKREWVLNRDALQVCFCF